MPTTINKIAIESEDPKSVLGTVLITFSDVQYWSKDALYDLYKGACELAIEYANDEKKAGRKKAVMSRFISIANNKLENLYRRYDKISKSDLLYFIYNEALSAEGTGLLVGFGYTNKFGDNLKGDSEKHRIKKGD